MADNTTGTELGIIQIESTRLTNIDNFFKGDENITLVKCPFPHVTSAMSAFEYCTNLESFEGDLNSLTNGTNTFYGCEKLDTFTGKLPRLSIGKSMFYYTNLSEFTEDLRSLQNGTEMFQECKRLKTFKSNLFKLTTYTDMFKDTKLNTFNAFEINVTDKGEDFMTISYLSNSKDTLTEFYCYLPNMTDTDNMFKNYTALRYFESYMSNVTTSQHMFEGCSNLYNVDIMNSQSLIKCYYMFNSCQALNEDNLTLIDTGTIENGVAMFSDTGITTNFFGENPKMTFPNLYSAKRMFQKSENISGSLHIDFTKQFPKVGKYSPCPNSILHDYGASGTEVDNNNPCAYMFENCPITELWFDVSTCNNCSYMFQKNKELTKCTYANFLANSSVMGQFSNIYAHGLLLSTSVPLAP